jgi:hypothetical protein
MALDHTGPEYCPFNKYLVTFNAEKISTLASNVLQHLHIRVLRIFLNDFKHSIKWARQLSRYSDWLRAGRFKDRIPVGARFSVHVQTGPGAHPASCTMGTEFFSRGYSGRGVVLTTHPVLAPRSRMSRAIPLLPLKALGGLL